MASGLRRFCYRNVALKIKSLLTTNRTKQDRAVELCSEQLDAHIHFAEIDKSPRTQLVTRIGLAIGSQCFFAIDSRRHIAPVGRRNRLSRNGLEIENIQGVGCAADEIVNTLKCRRLRKGFANRRNACEQRTRSEKFQKCTSIRHGVLLGSCWLQQWIVPRP